MSSSDVLRAVQSQYAAVARSPLSNESAAVRAVAEAFGYSEDELASLPPQANMGLSCTNESSLVSIGGEPPLHDQLATVLSRFDANAYAASVRIHAVKAVGISEPPLHLKENVMKTIQIYDRPMCCSTGVCGPSVDPVLPRFAADLAWLKSLGHHVDRYNLAQQPLAFTQNSQIHQLLKNQGTDCLPVVLVDGQVVSRGDYPSRDQLATWINATEPENSLPLAASGSCCQGSKCC